MIDLFLLQNCHAAAKVTETAGRHMPHMRFLGTNWWDVQLTFIICVTILIVALIVTIGIVTWQKEKLKAELEDVKKQSETDHAALLKDTANTTLIKEKDHPAFFKDICNLSKDKDGIIDDGKAEKLIALYQKFEQNASESGHTPPNCC